MDTTDQITASPEERGAGGKLRKQQPRKPPTTPYARPPDTTRRPWISKLVDPAFRLIAGGATRILPSFFSTTSSPDDITDHGKGPTGEQDHADDDHGHTDDGLKSDLHLWASKSTETASTDDIGGKLKSSSDFVLHRRDEKGGQSEESRLSDIEQLVKGNKFSRDEYNRLVEVLNSRAIDLPNVNQEKGNTSLTFRKDNKGLAVTHELPRVPSERGDEEAIGAIWGSSTPLGLSKDEISASPIEIGSANMASGVSPIEIARGYMACRASVLQGDEGARKPYDPSSSVKTSTCWPGAVVQDAYLTPQSERSRYGLQNFPRTPYSRTLLSKSRSKLSHVQDNHSHISSTPLRQSHMSLYPQDKSKVDALESGYGSVGPIRRSRHKVGAESSSRRSAYSSLNNPLQRESSVEGFAPTVTKSSDPYGTSTFKPFEVGVPTVHMHTSLMAKKILDHIDRSIPTPKEKSAELKLATKWKNPESSINVSTMLPNEDNGFLKLKDVTPYKYDGLDEKKSSLKGNEGQGNCHVDILLRESTDKTNNARKEGTLTSDMNVRSSNLRLLDNARAMNNCGGSQDLLVKSTKEDTLKTLPSGSQPHVVDQEKKPPFNSAASKPVLLPIAIKKPVSTWTLVSDNGSGFTFPVSASSSVFSEPPTPSIMPLFSSGDQHQSKEKSDELSYSFGLKRSSRALVFSFPSTSSTVHNDAGDIKFNFGSNEKARLSFSFGKNNVCC